MSGRGEQAACLGVAVGRFGDGRVWPQAWTAMGGDERGAAAGGLCHGRGWPWARTAEDGDEDGRVRGREWPETGKPGQWAGAHRLIFLIIYYAIYLLHYILNFLYNI